MNKIIRTTTDEYISYEFMPHEVKLYKILLDYAKHRLSEHHNSGIKKCVRLKNVEEVLLEVNCMLRKENDEEEVK